MEDKLKEQFSLRSASFDSSAAWITDQNLIAAHVGLAGSPAGKALDLCCGTGQMGKALKAAGWEVEGLDICPDMAAISSRFFPVTLGRAELLPFETDYFSLVVCRQSFQFFSAEDVLAEVSRVLKPGGTLVMSLTVPFSEKDHGWLSEIHRIKQPLLLQFYSKDDLLDTVQGEGFTVNEVRTLRVRESITRWMSFAPELSTDIREKVIAAVSSAPEPYRSMHRVEVKDGEVFEDWNWVVFRAAGPKG